MVTHLHLRDSVMPIYAIQSWLRNYSTLEFLMLWESKYNLDFNKDAYNELVRIKRRSSCGYSQTVE